MFYTVEMVYFYEIEGDGDSNYKKLTILVEFVTQQVKISFDL